ncbi:molybdenum cofactor biosynthesis protein MoaE [Nocardioides sp. GY 10127]|nr:molybdenum cofactor biosynthesis protein MoaE [Nocardioides sp. GY 10127]
MPDATPGDAPVGSGEPVVRLVDVRDVPLDVAEVVEVCDDEHAGGLTLFVGRVRDHDHGRGVDGLDYTGHPTALARLREVCEAVAARHPAVRALAAVHRVGTLGIGDVAVVVGAAAPHRDVAFEASRDLIDSLKQQVPIWKHQRFSDGGEEWVGTP